MLNEAFMVEFLTKIRALRTAHPETGDPEKFFDVIELIRAAGLHDGEEGNKVEVAKTILEIMEPERVGPLVEPGEPGEWPRRPPPTSMPSHGKPMSKDELRRLKGDGKQGDAECQA